MEAGDWAIDKPFWAGSNWVSVALLCVVLLPQLSLGLSGFEMSMILEPQVRGRKDDGPAEPRGRIRNTRKVLVAAAVAMSVYLLGSVLVTSVLIPPSAFGPGGHAANRALAYLAHGGDLASGTGAEVMCPLLGVVFGSIYDITTVLLLTLAGTSVMTALSVLAAAVPLAFRHGAKVDRPLGRAADALRPHQPGGDAVFPGRGRGPARGLCHRRSRGDVERLRRHRAVSSAGPLEERLETATHRTSRWWRPSSW